MLRKIPYIQRSVVTVAHSWVWRAVLCQGMYLSIWNMSTIVTCRRIYMYHISTYRWEGGGGRELIPL